MATSGSVDFNLTVQAVILEIMEQLGIKRLGGSVSGDEYTSVLRTLNMMLKAWQNDGIYLWCEQEAHLFLNEGQQSYQLGGSSGADKCVTSYIKTEISDDEASGQTVLSVDSSTGMAVTDVIGVELDDGTIHWTTIAAIPSSTSVTLTVALTDDAAEDNNVYTYDPDDIIGRPLEVSSLRLGYDSGTDVPMNSKSKREYFNIPNKTGEGSPNQYYVEKLRSYTNLYVYPTSENVKNVIHFSMKRIIEDLDNSTDNLDMPPEGIAAFMWNGCVWVANKMGKNEAISEMVSGSTSIAALAAIEYKKLKNASQEYASIKIRPKLDYYNN